MNYKELSDKAYYYHTNNKLDEAEELYKRLLGINPNDVNILNLYGLLCLSKSNYDLSIDLLSKALVLNKNAYIMSNLAKAYYMTSKYDFSLKLYKQAVELSPSDDIFYSIGILYKQLKNYDGAIASYKNAIKLNPSNYSALYNLAVIYKEIGNYKNSLKIAQKAEFINTNDKDIHSLLSNLYELNSNYKKAISHLEKAIKLNDNEQLYYYNLGVLYSKINKLTSSIENYKKVLDLNPYHIETLINLASIYRNIDINLSLKYSKVAYEHSKEEIVCLSFAQSLRDNYFNYESINILKDINSSEAYSLLAINYMDIQDYHKALEYYNKALINEPNNLNYLHGKAMALKYLGHFDEAKLLLEFIVSKDEKNIQSITTLGMLYLQEKNFEKGMELYIRRSEETKFNSLFKDKVWNKNVDLKDKIVLVYSDCGLGDTIMFSRYIPELKKIAKNVIIQTDKELINILKLNFKECRVIPKTIKNIEYDIVIPIMNLAFALNLDFKNIPHYEKYLSVNENTINECKKKIGIFYQGNKRVFKNRSISYNYVEKLLKLKQFQFYSFQIENNENETVKIINLKNKINNYLDTATLLKSMDMLITIDSSIAHMAGALGIKTFLLLPYTAEWRWFDDEKTTPWYKSVRIFKQKSSNDWNEVIDRVIKELSDEY